MQPCQIYYNLYNILYGTERHTISIKVEKIYYIMSYSDLYYKSIWKSHNYTIKDTKRSHSYYKITKLIMYSIVSHSS